MPHEPRLPNHVYDNIEAITQLRLADERALSGHQRFMEAITNRVGQPSSVYLLVSFLFLWMAYNLCAPREHWFRFDPAPFFVLQGIVGVYAALTTTMILVTQNRQSKDALRNAHLDLQVNIMAEQRTAKIIALLEELRRDLPDVPNRLDPVADALQHPIPANAVSDAIDETLGNQLDDLGASNDRAIKHELG